MQCKNNCCSPHGSILGHSLDPAQRYRGAINTKIVTTLEKIFFVRHQRVVHWSLHTLWSLKILNNTTVALGYVTESPIAFS